MRLTVVSACGQVEITDHAVPGKRGRRERNYGVHGTYACTTACAAMILRASLSGLEPTFESGEMSRASRADSVVSVATMLSLSLIPLLGNYFF